MSLERVAEWGWNTQLLEPLPAIGIGSPAFAERLQAALAETMEQLQAQREQAQEPPPQRSRGFDMEP